MDIEYKFKVGDRVRSLDNYWGVPVGRKGTVVSVVEGYPELGIQFDENVPYGHDCSGAAKAKRGRYLGVNEVERLEECPRVPLFRNAPPVRIIITKDGDTTTARRVCGKKDITEVSVKRCHKDKDDEFVAAIRAVEKLYGRSVTELCGNDNYKAKTSVTLVQEYATLQKALALRLLADLKEVDEKEESTK